MAVNSTIKIDQGKIRKLTRASIRALEKTAEAVHTTYLLHSGSHPSRIDIPDDNTIVWHTVYLIR